MMSVGRDGAVMPFGKHRGKAMKDVPLDWYFWFCEQQHGFKVSGWVREVYQYGMRALESNPAEYEKLKAKHQFKDKEMKQTLIKFNDLVGDMMDKQSRYFELRKTFDRSHPDVLEALRKSKAAEDAVRKFRQELKQLLAV